MIFHEEVGNTKRKTREVASNSTIQKKSRMVTAFKELQSTIAWALKLVDTRLGQSKVSNAHGNFYDNEIRIDFQEGKIKFSIWK